MTDRTRDALACLLLRFGVAWFIFVWAVNKLLAPAQYQQLASWFDKVDVSTGQVYSIAVVQIVICLCVFAGWQRIVSYAALAAIHGYTVYRQWEKYIAPFEINDKGFPVNPNVTDSLAVLFAMVALLLLRHRDHWALDARSKRRG
ncbi:MAG: hypothetical protein AAF415_17450 [Pseudomonadota bacterium]